MKLELFQTTVMGYKYFAQQLPIDYSKVLLGDFSDFTYVAAQTRLMLLRKYIRKGKGSLYLSDVVDEAIQRFPEHLDYLSEFKVRFQQSCDQSLNCALADGTERTLNESIDDTMYGLFLHADEERIKRISQDNELLRLYCIVRLVKEIEALIIELFNFFEKNGVSFVEKAHHLQAPVIHLKSQDSEARNIIGSPFWRNLIGSDMTEKNIAAAFTNSFAKYTFEEWKLWMTAYAFTQLLAQGEFSYDKIKQLVFGPTIGDWGDFSDAIAYYKGIPSPGISSIIRYNEQRNIAYIHVFPHVEKGFIIDSPQLISDAYIITLVKNSGSGEWKVFAFGGHIDPFIRE
ncbi:MAG: hypothetical protein LKJ50_04750 [Clostridiales bacterium]|nr:hypothetical protein [Clostridiales bacterium]MCI1961249.1 hypothetical protein [Clostridiales bacterium]MCI2021690.1 hypothetical protein [Clostridiales bacterium]MCI2026476.1 hypothetical protein [Clostridiales bacterium]